MVVTAIRLVDKLPIMRLRKYKENAILCENSRFDNKCIPNFRMKLETHESMRYMIQMQPDIIHSISKIVEVIKYRVREDLTN